MTETLKNIEVPQGEVKTRHQALECIPVKNPQVKEEIQDNGEVRLIYQVQVRPWFQGVIKKLMKKDQTLINRTLQLDILGSIVWQMIDGTKSVHTIIKDFQTDNQINRREAELSVTSFFKELGKRGLLAMREKE